MFRLGSQAGLKPDEVLDLSLPVYQAVVDGYSARLTDLKVCAVLSGYYSGYYNRAKRPKDVSKIIDSLLKEQSPSKKKEKVSDVDVASFIEQEKRFKAAYTAQQSLRKE